MCVCACVYVYVCMCVCVCDKYRPQRNKQLRQKLSVMLLINGFSGIQRTLPPYIIIIFVNNKLPKKIILHFELELISK